MAPRILIFSIAMGADYSFELISIVHGVPKYIGHNKIFQGSVRNALSYKQILCWRKLQLKVLDVFWVVKFLESVILCLPLTLKFEYYPYIC